MNDIISILEIEQRELTCEPVNLEFVVGLALVKITVEAHGVQITVTSEVGKGTTFTLLLPIGL